MLGFLKRYYPIIIIAVFQIQSLSAFEAAIIGGRDNGFITPYTALVSPSGVASTLTGAIPIGAGEINSVGINASGAAIIGGVDNGHITPYVALVSLSGVASALTGATPIGAGLIYSVGINASGTAIIGGVDNGGGTPYVSLVSPSGVASALTGATPTGNSWIYSVGINASGAAIVGGFDNGGIPYAALVSPIGVASALTGATPTGNGLILSVGINVSGTAIIGGQDNGFITPYVAIVSPSGVASTLTGALPTGNGLIYSVGINASGAAIIGGVDNGNAIPYAAIVSPSGVASALTGATPTGNGRIYSVGINASGVAIIGGQDNGNTTPYVALVSPSGVASALTGATPIGNGEIYSVGIGDSILSMVDPKSFGSGNTFADPIFALSTTVLENHLKKPQEREPFSENETTNLTADAQDIIRPAPSCQDSPKYVLWGSPFGLYAHHKKSGPFPDLRDRSFGGIIGFDYLGWEGFVLGGGGAYAYQNIGYSNNFGKARVNQEFLTVYGAWHQKHIAIQGALWGGLYQMHNTRKTLGFISSTSHVNGWIFSPHLEISSPFKRKDITIEPFVMFDWVNNWQGSVKEQGKSGLNLRIDRHYVSLLRSEIGLHFLESFQFKKGRLTFEESFSYVNKTPFNAKRMSTYYVGSISTFNLQMFSNRTVNLGALRLSGRFTPCSLKPPYVYLTYQGEFGSNLLSHTVALEVGKRF